MRLILIALDGLSLGEFETLTSFLPRSARSLAAGSTSLLSTEPLTDAAAIWAEILTGTPWHRNGCAGHARPWRSLNQTRIMTERDLGAPVRLLPETSRQLIINVPLLEPRPATRVWLSDGSLPLPIRFSPASLAEIEPVAFYRPRPYVALAEVVGFHPGAVPGCLETEQMRLSCAQRLLADNPDIAIIRLSAFDQLAHLLGQGWLSARDLAFRDHIDRFLGRLDEFLVSILDAAERVLILSAFAHEPCRLRLSLNTMLERRGLLSFGRPDEAAGRRAAAVAALGKSRSGTSSAFSPAALYDRPNWQQPTFDLARTIAASPVLGGVYINTAGRFDGGIVAPTDLPAARAALRESLADDLRHGAGGDITIRSLDNVEAAERVELAGSLPDLLVHVPGVEFHNNPDPLFGPTDTPRSVHSPEGFLWSRSALPSTMPATEVCAAVPDLQSERS